MKLEKTVSLLLTIVIFVTTLTCHVSATTNLEDSSIYFKQTSGSKYCTLDSVAMMFRRKAILDGNDNWVFINEKSMIAQEGNWGSSGLAGEPKYKDLVQGLNMKATGKLLYRLKNNNYKKNSNTLAIINKLKSELDSHKEGIVLYLYNEKYDEVKEKNKILWQHAVILTSYIGDVFYCADPATNKGIINLLNSTLAGKNKANTNYVDELLSYSVKIWYISSSSNSSTRSSAPVEIEEKPTKVNASDDNEYDVNNKKKTCWWHVSYDSKGYCKSCGTEYDMNIKNMSATTYQAVKNDVPVRNRPYSPEKITKWLSKGTKVTVVASGQNAAGNLWYKLNDGSWIYSKNLEKAKEVVPEVSTLKINVTQYPTTINQGKSFGLRGEINSNYNVTSVKGYIINSNGKTVMSTSDSPNSKSNNIRYLNLNEGMTFGDLSAGNYTLEIVAKDSFGKSQTWSKDFTVKGEEVKPSTPANTSCSHSYNKSGYCSKCNKEYSISLSSMNATYEAVKNDVPVRNRPYSPDKIIKNLSKGTKVTVVASGKNSVGNLWYKLNDGTWIYSENLKKSSSGSSSTSGSQTTTPSTSIRFEIESMPKGNLPYGKSFSLKGWFRSDSPIVEARAYMLDANKNIVMQSDPASSTTSNYKIQGYKLDKAMKFNKLSPGGYYLKFFVRDANGDTFTWVSDKFYIVK